MEDFEFAPDQSAGINIMIRDTNTCAGRHVFELRAGPFFVSETVHTGGQTLARHEHQVAILHCVLSGFYYESVGPSPLRLGPGEFLFKPPGMSHRNRFDADGVRTLRIEFSPADCQSIGATLPMAMCSGANINIRRIAENLKEEINLPDIHAPLAIECLCLELLNRLQGSRPPGHHMRQAARRCAELLRRRFDEPLSFTRLSESLGVDRTQLAKAFRATHGCTMGEYLRRVRIAFVHHRLLTSDLTLAVIARAAGFADQSHCTRTFRRVVGESPGRWRRSQHRA